MVNETILVPHFLGYSPYTETEMLKALDVLSFYRMLISVPQIFPAYRIFQPSLV